MQQLYRYRIVYSHCEFSTKIFIETYYVIRETEKSLFISLYRHGAGEKVIRKTALKNPRGFCAETEEFALKQLKNRTEKRLEWFAYFTQECNEALKILDNQ